MAGEVVSWPEKLAGDPSAAARSGDACSRRSAAVENPKKIRKVCLGKWKMMRDVLQAGKSSPRRRSRKSLAAMADGKLPCEQPSGLEKKLVEGKRRRCPGVLIGAASRDKTRLKTPNRSRV